MGAVSIATLPSLARADDVIGGCGLVLECLSCFFLTGINDVFLEDR